MLPYVVRFFLLVAALVVGSVALVTSCNDSSCASEIDISTPEGCVKFVSVDCSFEGGAAAPGPMTFANTCPANFNPAVTMNTYHHQESMTCTVLVTCADNHQEHLNVAFGCSSSSFIWPNTPLRACASDDGGLDASDAKVPDANLDAVDAADARDATTTDVDVADAIDSGD